MEVLRKLYRLLLPVADTVHLNCLSAVIIAIVVDAAVLLSKAAPKASRKEMEIFEAVSSKSVLAAAGFMIPVERTEQGAAVAI